MTDWIDLAPLPLATWVMDFIGFNKFLYNFFYLII